MKDYRGLAILSEHLLGYWPLDDPNDGVNFAYPSRNVAMFTTQKGARFSKVSSPPTGGDLPADWDEDVYSWTAAANDDYTYNNGNRRNFGSIRADDSEDITISVLVYPISTSGSFQIFVFYPGGNSQTTWSSLTVGTWTRITKTFTLPGSFTAGEVFCRMDNNNSGQVCNVTGFWLGKASSFPGWTPSTRLIRDTSGNDEYGCVRALDAEIWNAVSKRNKKGIDYDASAVIDRLKAIDIFGSSGEFGDFNYTDAFSLECWFRCPSSLSNIMGLVNNFQTSGIGYRTYVDTSGNIVFSISDTSSNTISITTNNMTYDDATYWHHMIATYNGSGAVAGMSLIIDGVKNAVSTSGTTISASITPTDVQAAFSIGKELYTNTTNSQGEIVRVGLYDIALNTHSVQALYLAGFERRTVYEQSDSKCVLHNTVGSLNEIEHSIIGQNGSAEADSGSTFNATYAEAKFGNGIKFPSGGEDADDYGIIFPLDGNYEVNSNNGCFECWVTCDVASTTSDGSNRCLFTFRYDDYGTSTDTHKIAFWINYNPTSSPAIRVGATGASVTVGSTNLSFNAAEEFHLAVSWDRSAGTNGEFYIYKNNVLVWTYSPVAGHWDADIPWAFLAVGNRMVTNDDFASDLTDSLIDNVRVWNYTKKEFSDINKEPISFYHTPRLHRNPDECLILFDRMQDLQSSENSVVGLGCTETGTALFDTNGQYGAQHIADSSTGNLNHLDIPSFGNFVHKRDAWAFSWWWHAGYAASDNTGGHFWYFFNIWDSPNGTRSLAGDKILMQHQLGPSLQVAFYTGSVDYPSQVDFNMSADPSGWWASGDNIHFTLLFDRNGIDGGSNYCELWIDDTMRLSYSGTQPKQQIMNGVNFPVMSDWSHAAAQYPPNNTGMSMLKILAYAKTNFEDHNYPELLNVSEIQF